MFYDELVEIFDFLGASGKDRATDDSARQSHFDASLSGLRERLNVENGPSESCTWYMRVLTACRECPQLCVSFVIPPHCLTQSCELTRTIGTIQK